MAFRMLGVDQGNVERDLRLPARSSWPAAIESDVVGDDLRDGAARAAFQSDAQQVAGDVARAPELRRGGRHQRLGETDETLDERERARPEGECRPSARAEQIGDEWKVGPFDVAKDQGRAAGGDYAAMDLGGLEDGVDGRADLDDVARGAESVEETAEIGSTHPEAKYIR